MKKKVITLVLALTFTRASVSGMNLLDTNAWAASSVASVVIVAVTSGISTLIISIGLTASAGEGSDEVLMRYMKANHVQLKHDFSLASGSFFNDLAYELVLTQNEKQNLANEFEGSIEQQTIMQTLNGEITLEKAGLFSTTMATYLLKIVGPQRMVEVFGPRMIN